MIKYSTPFIAVLCSFSAQVFASDFYVAGTVSRQILRYDVNGYIDSELDKGNRRDYISAINLLGGNVDTSADLTSTSQKFTLGYSLMPSTSVELSYREYGKSKVTGNASLGFSVDELLQYKHHTAAISASASAEMNSVVSVKANSMAISAIHTIYKPFYIRLGAERLHITVKEMSSETYKYQYTVDIDNGEHLYSDQYSSVRTKTKKKYYSIVSPLFGVGAEFPIVNNLSLRLEWERTGTFNKGFDFYSAGIKFSF